MAYNLPPPDGGDLGGGFPGGFGFPGFGKSFSLDAGAGWGLPGFGGGGFGGFPSWGSPYVPITPLGGLWGFKGDLIVPIVAIGVAIFILILIVLAVKYALAWKLSVLGDLAGKKTGKYKREAPAPQLEDSNLNRLADMVSAAVYSEGCSKRILCEIGAYAREGKQYPSLIRLMELVVPEDYHQSLLIVREAAESKFSCEEKYPCGGDSQAKNDPSLNEINVSEKKGKTSDVKPIPNIGAPPTTKNKTATNTSTVNAPASGATPAPSVFGKFQRAIFDH